LRQRTGPLDHISSPVLGAPTPKMVNRHRSAGN